MFITVILSHSPSFFELETNAKISVFLYTWLLQSLSVGNLFLTVFIFKCVKMYIIHAPPTAGVCQTCRYYILNLPSFRVKEVNSLKINQGHHLLINFVPYVKMLLNIYFRCFRRAQFDTPKNNAVRNHAKDDTEQLIFCWLIGGDVNL